MTIRDERRKKRQAKLARKRERHERAERLRREVYSKEAPLLLEGRVASVASEPTALHRLRRPLMALVRRVPVEPASSAARRRVTEVRIGAALLGVALALFGGSPATTAVGGLMLILAAALPASHGTRARWTTQIGLFGRRTRRTTHEVGIAFDGRGCSVTGPSWGSRRVLTHEGAHRLELRRIGDRIGLGVLPLKGGKAAQLWFVAAADGLPLDPGGLEEKDPGELDGPVAVDAATLLALHEAIRPDELESLDESRRA